MFKMQYYKLRIFILNCCLFNALLYKHTYMHTHKPAFLCTVFSLSKKKFRLLHSKHSTRGCTCAYRHLLRVIYWVPGALKWATSTPSDVAKVQSELELVVGYQTITELHHGIPLLPGETSFLSFTSCNFPTTPQLHYNTASAVAFKILTHISRKVPQDKY